MTACTDFYSHDEILAAKNFIFETVRIANRNIGQKGANKFKMCMEDIMKIFLEMDVMLAPVFVALDLANVPPLTIDFGSLKIKQGLDRLQRQVNSIATSQNEVINMLQGGFANLVPSKQHVAMQHIHCPVYKLMTFIEKMLCGQMWLPMTAILKCGYQ